MSGFALLIAIGLGVAIAAPKPIEVTFDNRSNVDVNVFKDGYHAVSARADAKERDGLYDCGDDGCLIEISDEDGHVMCSFMLTEELAGRIESTIVIGVEEPYCEAEAGAP